MKWVQTSVFSRSYRLPILLLIKSHSYSFHSPSFRLTNLALFSHLPPRFLCIPFCSTRHPFFALFVHRYFTLFQFFFSFTLSPPLLGSSTCPLFLILFGASGLFTWPIVFCTELLSLDWTSRPFLEVKIRFLHHLLPTLSIYHRIGPYILYNKWLNVYKFFPFRCTNIKKKSSATTWTLTIVSLMDAFKEYSN